MSLFTNEIDERIKELQKLEEYKYGKGQVNNKKIAETINAEFGTNYTAKQIRDHRHNVINGYFQSEKGKEAQKKYAQSEKGKNAQKRYDQSKKGKDRTKNRNSKIATKINIALVELAKTKYGREVLGLNKKETRAYLKENQLQIDHIIPIPLDYIEDLCRASNYSWKYWSDVPKYLQKHLKSMCNDISNLQLLTREENNAKRDLTKRTRHY